MDKKKLIDKQFQLLRQRVCFVCVLREGGRLRVCQNCQIMQLIGEIERKVKELEKFE